MKRTSKRLLSILLCAVLLLSMLPAAALAEENTVTVYAKVPDSWSDPCCWAWGANSANVFEAWPGEAMTQDGEWYTIEVPAWVSFVIISGNSGSIQTADLSIVAGYDVWIDVKDTDDVSISYGDADVTPEVPTPTELDAYYVAGSSGLCGSEWEPSDPANQMTKVSAGVYQKTYTDVPAGEYYFKVTGGTWDYNWGGDSIDGNYRIELRETRDVTIIFYTATGTIVTNVDGLYPEPEKTEPQTNANYYYVISSDGLCGSEGDSSDPKNRLTEISEGVFEIILTDVPAGEYTFKVNGDTWADTWGGYPVDGHYYIHMVYESDVKITFYEDSRILDVFVGALYPLTGSDIPAYYVAGSAGLCGSAWDSDDENNRMTPLTTWHYEISYEGVAAGTYEFWVTDPSGEHTYGKDGGSEKYKLIISEKSDIKIIFNTITKTVIVCCTKALIAAGTWGDGYTWEISVKGVMTVNGKGVFDWGTHEEVSRDSVTEVILKGISGVGNGAFHGFANLKKVTISGGVTKIGDSAFSYCPKLFSVAIPYGVSHIGERAFEYCTSLWTISIPSTVKKIGKCAFYRCDGLEKIEVAEGNPTYSSDSFGVLFNKAKTKLIQFPTRLEVSYVVPETVTHIEDYACSYATYLHGITLPDGLRSIGMYAFTGSALNEITIPKNLTTIGDFAFDQCTGLEKFKVNKDNSVFSSDQYGVLYNKVKTELVRAPLRIQQYTVPQGVTLIRKGAFRQCDFLSSVTIPDNVTQIGEMAFQECDALTSVTIPGSVQKIGNHAFQESDNLEKVTIKKGVTEIGGWTFYNCKSLKQIVIPSTVTEMGDCIFLKCGSLQEIELPEGLTSISHWAFNGCGSLEKIVVPASVTQIGELAFSSCHSLTGVDILGNVSTIDQHVFLHSENLRAVVFHGDAPAFDKAAFYDFDGTVYYPKENKTWTEAVRQDYQGAPQWKGYKGSAKTVRITCQPTGVAVDEGVTAKVTVNAEGYGLTYKWYYKDANSKKFVYTPTYTSKTYSVPMTAARSGRQVYCVVTDRYGISVTTKTVTLKMRTPLKITKQPVSVTVQEGILAAVTVGVQGDGLTYQWYFANAGATKFSYTKTFKTNTYSTTMNAARSGRRVYCVITDKYGNSVKTNTVTLGMGTALRIITQPVGKTVPAGTVAELRIYVRGEGLTYKWYYANKGSNKFTPTNTFKAGRYALSMNAARDGRRVYCVITDKYGNSVKTKTVTLAMTNLKITKQPVSVTVAPGAVARVNVEAQGEGLTYKWYYASPDTNKFSRSKSFTGNTYSVSMTEARAGRRVYCVIIDKYGNRVATQHVTLNMATRMKITKQPVSVTVASGAKAQVSVAVEGEELTYQWYFCDLGSVNFFRTPTFTGSTYAVTMNKDRHWRKVYCVITDKYGDSVVTDVAVLKMK